MNPLRVAPILLAIVASVAAEAAIDPALLDLAPPGAKVLCGIQVQQALSSPFGQFLLSRMPGNGATLLGFAAATGFDPRRDLREVLLAGSVAPGNGNDGVLLARGTFQIDKLIALAATIHASNANYAGVPLITPAEPRAPTIAVLDSSTMAIGSESAVKSVIDRRAARLAFSGPLAEKALAASASGDAWVATVTPLAALAPANTGSVPVTFVQAVIESSAGLRFDAGGVTLSAEALTHSANEAEGLVTVLKFVAGMVKGPQGAALQGAQFASSGPVTRITLTIPEQDLERAFPATPQGRAAR